MAFKFGSREDLPMGGRRRIKPRVSSRPSTPVGNPRSTAEVFNVESDKERPPHASRERPYYGTKEKDLPTEKERWAKTHAKMKAKRFAKAKYMPDAVNPRQKAPNVGWGILDDVEPSPYSHIGPRKAPASARRARIAAATERRKSPSIIARGQPVGRARATGRLETASPAPKDSPKGAAAFKGMVRRAAGSERSSEVASRQAWHRKFGATPPFSGRYPNQPSTVRRVATGDVKTRPKASWKAPRGGTLGIAAEPLAYGIGGVFKSGSLKGFKKGLDAWKSKYSPPKPWET